MPEVAATEEEVVVEEAAEFLTRMVGQIMRLLHRLTKIMPRWVVRLRRLGTLRSHLAVGLRRTRTALEVAGQPPQPAMSNHQMIRHGSPMADRDTSGITTSRTPSDGRLELGRAQHAGPSAARSSQAKAINRRRAKP